MSSNQNTMSMGEKLCCVSIKSRDSMVDWMLLDDGSNYEPSLFQRCLCQCSPKARVRSGIEYVPEIAALAGATLQRGNHGVVMTLKWADFDAEKKEIFLEVFGGCGGKSHHSQWAEPVTKNWFLMMNVGRLCDYSYKIKFSNDWQRADIFIMGNLGCCCFPAWFTVPERCLKFEMVQAEGSTDGSLWYRNSAACGGELSRTYDLVEAFKVDGTPGKYHVDFLKEAPEQMLITR